MKIVEIMADSDLVVFEALFQEKVHKNPSISTLKNLARHNKYHSARFVIYKDGNIVAADSEKFDHYSMAPAMAAWDVRGYVVYQGNDDYAYRSMEPNSAITKDHPILRFWEKYGIVNGNPDHSTNLTEGKNMPVIVVDVQPEYSGINDGDENPVFLDIIHFVNQQTGPVLMFANAEETGITGDSITDIKRYWEDTVRGEDADFEDPNYDEEPINWNRFTIIDKGYGYLRPWMDSGIPERTIIKTIRLMYQQKVSDSRDLVIPHDEKHMTPDIMEIKKALDQMGDDPIYVNWISVAQLKRFSGSYIVGGGRNECLREVELLMNAFNIKYKRIDSLVYG